MFDNKDIIDFASKFKFFIHNRPDDFADELSFKYSCFIFISSSLIIVFKQYFMKPISCYVANSPNKKGMISYIENYCWVAGTVPITYNGRLPSTAEEFKLLDKEKILYYQWIPFILGIQALLCYMPQLIWRLFYTKSAGLDLKQLIIRASNASNLDSDSRRKEVEQLSQTLETLLFQTKEFEDGKLKSIRKCFSVITSILLSRKRLGTHLVIFYLFVKCLYLLNSIGQIFIMQSYLNLNLSNYTLFGGKILQNIISGKDWQNTSVFARVAYCFAKFPQLGVVNVVMAQCVLPVNMLNEKLYMFFWFWMVLVSIVTSSSICLWIFRVVIRNYGTSFIKKCLILNNDYIHGDKFNKRITKFEDYFLRSNGLFILQMLASNAGEIITAEVISQLWKVYKAKYEERYTENDNDLKQSLKDEGSRFEILEI